MALIRAFTDLSGNQCASAYWRLVQLNIGALDGALALTFYGWKDQTAFQAGREPLAGAVKSYTVSGSEFATVASAAPVGTSLYDVLAHASEAYAVGKLDVPGPTGGDGKPTMVSFFAGATPA